MTKHTLSLTIKSIIGVLLFIPSVWYVYTADIYELIRFFPDDGFYTIKSAINLFELGFSTFDGVNPNNGFHPLNFIFTCLAAISGNKILILKLLFLQVTLFIIIASFTLDYHILRKHLNSKFLRILGIIILSSPVFVPYLYMDAGMEMQTAYLCCIISIYCLEQAFKNNFSCHKENILMAIVMALTILSRLDSFIFFIPVCLYIIFLIISKKDLWRKFVIPFIIAFTLLGTYLVINFLFFGIWVPISGIIKTSIPSTAGNNWIAMIGIFPLIGYYSVFGFIVLGLIAIFLLKDKKVRTYNLLILVGGILQLIYILFYSTHAFRWYLAIPIAIQMYFLSIIYAQLTKYFSASKQVKNNLLLLLPIYAIFFATTLLAFTKADNINTTSYQVMKITNEFNKHLDKNDVVLMMDAGIFGYFCNARIINIEGLANSHSNYSKYLSKNKFKEYFEKEKATHFGVRPKFLFQDKANKNILRFYMDQRVILKKENILGAYDLWHDSPGLYLVKLD